MCLIFASNPYKEAVTGKFSQFILTHHKTDSHKICSEHFLYDVAPQEHRRNLTKGGKESSSSQSKDEATIKRLKAS